MNQELQKYYDSLFDLFASEGWKNLLDDFQSAKASIESIRGVEDAKTLHYRQGQLDVLDRLFTLQTLTEQSFKLIQEGSQ